MAWGGDPNWELDPRGDAKRMAREHPPADTPENRLANRVGLIVAGGSLVVFIAAFVIVAFLLL